MTCNSTLRYIPMRKKNCPHKALYTNVHGSIDYYYQKLKVKVAQSCLTLCDPIEHTVHGILQARILEWVAFPFSRGSFQPRDQTQVSHMAGGFLPTELSGNQSRNHLNAHQLMNRYSICAQMDEHGYKMNTIQPQKGMKL